MRECTICPPEILVCVHLDERWIVLHEIVQPGTSHYTRDNNFVVCVGSKPILFTLEREHLGQDYHRILGYRSTYEDGLALLREVEERLLSEALV